MWKKNKAMVLDSAPSYGVGVYEDAKARMKHQTLMQEYQELQQEFDVMRSKLEAGKQRKMMLAAEVRFLRRRYQYLVELKAINTSEKEKVVQPSKLPKQAKNTKGFSRKEASPAKLPPIPKPRNNYIAKGVVPLHGTSPASQHHMEMLLHGRKEATQHSLTLISDLDHKVRTNIKKKSSTRKKTPALDLNQKGRVLANDTAALRNGIVDIDLNQDNSANWKEVSLPSRAPIFDLNEISTGDEDIQSNVEAVKFEEVEKTRDLNDEVQNDLMHSMCRSAGEVPFRVGKRKISWQDPVALRV